MERFLKWTTRCYRRPWAVLAVVAVVTAFFALGVPKVKFSNDLRSMLPADNPAIRMNDYYEDESRFGHSAADYIGVESDDAFSVRSLQYLRTIKAEVERLNETLPVRDTAAYLGIGEKDAEA